MNIKIKRNLFKSNKEILKIFNEYHNINYITFIINKDNNIYFYINKKTILLFYDNNYLLLNLLSYLIENTNIIIKLKNVNFNEMNYKVIDLNKFNEIENKKEIENYKNYIIELMKNYKI